MRIIIENSQSHGGCDVSRVCVETVSDDLTIEAAAVLVTAALVAYGFHPESVNEIFVRE